MSHRPSESLSGPFLPPLIMSQAPSNSPCPVSPVLLSSPLHTQSPAEDPAPRSPFLAQSSPSFAPAPSDDDRSSPNTANDVHTATNQRSITEGIRNMLSCSPRIWHSEQCPDFPSIDASYHADLSKESHFASSYSANELQLSLEHDSPHSNNHAPPTLPALQYTTDACVYSTQFPAGHHLNTAFVQTYQLEDELGSGGYGFVMTAYNRVRGQEVAVKFIIKDKVPEHAWMEDEVIGRLPTEVVLLSFVNHENIVKCLDLYEDERYFYLVQELHGAPWSKHLRLNVCPDAACDPNPSPSLLTPALSPSSSDISLPSSAPTTPPHHFATLKPDEGANHTTGDDIPKLLHQHLTITGGRPEITRRPSHDLFECIEQSANKRLSEAQARYVFGQVVDAVEYLDQNGITHRDIKDENLVIDKNLKVKLIDFGSAIAVDPAEPRPYYKLFYGTAAYASSEILLKKEYQAAPAEVWTLGVLLSYLLAGVSPFPTVQNAVDGRIFLSEKVCGKLPPKAMELMRWCLDPNPETRATISQIKTHPWLQCSSEEA